MAVSEHPNVLYHNHAKIYPKHISKEILRMKCLDIDEKLDKRDLALVKISDTGAGEEYGEAASYSTWVGWRGKNFFTHVDLSVDIWTSKNFIKSSKYFFTHVNLSVDKQKRLSSQAQTLNICHIKERIENKI